MHYLDLLDHNQRHKFLPVNIHDDHKDFGMSIPRNYLNHKLSILHMDIEVNSIAHFVLRRDQGVRVHDGLALVVEGVDEVLLLILN